MVVADMGPNLVVREYIHQIRATGIITEIYPQEDATLSLFIIKINPLHGFIICTNFFK